MHVHPRRPTTPSPAGELLQAAELTHSANLCLFVDVSKPLTLVGSWSGAHNSLFVLFYFPGSFVPASLWATWTRVRAVFTTSF